MLKKTMAALSLLLGLLSIFAFIGPKPVPPTVRTIILDAGHGGKDPGAAGLQSTEAQICLAITKKLGARLEKEVPGLKVLYTRTTDIIPGNKSNKDEGLRYRADFANQSNADLFISIHCNSAGRAPGGWNERRIVDYEEKVTYVGKKKRKKVSRIPVYESFYVVNEASGTETYVWTAKENSHKEQLINTAEFGGEADSSISVPENDPVINALKMIYAKKYFVNSYRLADLVQKEFEKSGRVNRGVKQRNDRGIWVLHATGMPSILIETGFISNKQEEDYLVSDTGQEEVAENITNALKSYINLLDKTPSNDSSSKTGGAATRALLESIEQKERKTVK